MYKVYRKVFLNFVQHADPYNPTNYECLNKSIQIQNGQNSILYRLPQSQLRKFLTMPCPINNLQHETAHNAIQLAKNMRATVGINENKSCSKCPLAGQCPHSGITGKPQIQRQFANIVQLMEFRANLDIDEDSKQSTFLGLVAGCHLTDSLMAICSSLPQNLQIINQFNHLWVHYITQQQKNPAKQPHQKKINSSNSQLKNKHNQIHHNNPQDEDHAMLQSLNLRLQAQNAFKKSKNKKSAKKDFINQTRDEEFQRQENVGSKLESKNRHYSDANTWQRQSKDTKNYNQQNKYPRRQNYGQQDSYSYRNKSDRYGDRPYQDRSFQDRSFQDRSYKDRSYKDRPYKDRSYQNNTKSQKYGSDTRDGNWRNSGKYIRQNERNARTNHQGQQQRYNSKYQSRTADYENDENSRRPRKYQEPKGKVKQRWATRDNEKYGNQKNNQEQQYEPKIRKYEKKYVGKTQKHLSNNQEQTPFVRKFDSMEFEHDVPRRSAQPSSPSNQFVETKNHRKGGRRVIRP